ncbi:hypothetical protein DY000_02023342 [Brassica cretica]|uniref:Uncharacterized protein n=1 Tax=Brassica cretica TaxID=69181 RepID=A0ABQ7EDS1_BRACR|nr:hypothetical protein DY000_02023342 [Brassica cretica]
MLPGWDPDLAFGDGSGTSEVPILNFDDFFAGLPSGFDAPPATNESGRPKVVADGSHIINGVRAEEEEVNYIGGAGFQGNQGGNINSYGNRSNFNQNSQYQKPYNNSYNNNMNFGSSYYQKPPPPTQERKIEEMLDRVLEAQQRKTVGTEIRTVDFRLNKESRRTLISQRSRISANTTR